MKEECRFGDNMTFSIRFKSKTYKNKHDSSNIIALKNIDIKIKKKEFVCIVGPSGCGKTTLMNIIGGLINAEGKEIYLNEKKMDTEQNLGYVFQTSRLLPWLTLNENIKLVCKETNFRIEKRIQSLLRSFELEEFGNAYPNTISGGMRRKVSLARAFVNNPDILLMDEPFISLDQPTSEMLYRVLKDYWNKHPTIVLLITHNLKEALLLGDRILFFSKRPGTVVFDYTVKKKPLNLTKIDSISVEKEYNHLTKKYPRLLKGLI